MSPERGGQLTAAICNAHRLCKRQVAMHSFSELVERCTAFTLDALEQAEKRLEDGEAKGDVVKTIK
jgi:hypothetical protein